MAEADPAAVAGYLQQMWESGDDPWQISAGWYEQRKRAAVLAALSRPRYHRAFEPACAGGVLTEQLAPRVDSLLASDAAERAVALTRARVPSAEVRQLQLPAQWPDGAFDLIVLSEFGYYLSPTGWIELARRVAASLTGNWTVLACHWRHDFPQRAAATSWLHQALAAELAGVRQLSLLDADFQLDVWGPPGASLAAQEGRLD